MRIIFRGTVQGVGFRPAVYRTASSLGINGSVRNEGSDVIVEADRGEEFLEAFLEDLPPLARISSYDTFPSHVPAEGFIIEDSRDQTADGEPSIPADTAVCDRCLEDMVSGRRNGYPFTTCTCCGPRFTLMRSLPYDRARTSMSAFGMCSVCSGEYRSPQDRRFHHQTVCCPVCGPSYRLYSDDGEELPGDPIATFARMLDGGKVGISKGWGGMHISCTLPNVARLRKIYGRPYKPFAVMVRDIGQAERYATVAGRERELLLSPQRPIVLVRKKDIPEDVSPGIDTVGMFLPYTGMQHILFSHLEADAIIMTSANMPGEPMVIRNEDAFGLGADICLLHDQEIVQRADDTVVRTYGDRTFHLRKSRGCVPCSYATCMKGDAVAVGAQENLAAAVAVNGRIYPTQYIGNGEGLGVPEYLDGALRHMIGILGAEPSVIAEDLHPMYANRKLARRLSEETGAEVIDVQHHWAHGASLMVDGDISDGLTYLALDGTGHGDDGQAWGGEVMRCDFNGYKRLAHLEYLPLLGGQKAVSDIRRLRLAIDMANGTASDTGFSDAEISNLGRLAQRSVKTSSFGRMLDALAYSEGVCSVRTYDGEPAMRLERYIDPVLRTELAAHTERGSVKFAHLFDGPHGRNTGERVTGIVRAVLKEMVDIACDDAQSEGRNAIGITGGVSYDVPIVRITEELAASRGMRLIVHDRVPNGDGGISTGQAAIALARRRRPPPAIPVLRRTDSAHFSGS